MSATLLHQLKPQMRKCFKSCRLSEVSGPGLGEEEAIESAPRNVHRLGACGLRPYIGAPGLQPYSVIYDLGSDKSVWRDEY